MEEIKIAARDEAGHKRAYNHLDYYLGKVLENTDGFLDINEIRNLLKNETGVLFHPDTLRKYIRRYAEEHGMGPLCKFGDKYRLNRCLYKLAEIKAPRIHGLPNLNHETKKRYKYEKQTEHRRVYRHIDYFLGRALINYPSFLSLEEIQYLLKEETGFLFSPKTIINYNNKYIEKHGIGPLWQLGEKYELNMDLYNQANIKPPGIKNHK